MKRRRNTERKEDKKRKIEIDLDDEEFMMSVLYTEDATLLKDLIAAHEGKDERDFFLSSVASFPHLKKNIVKVLLDAGIDERNKNTMFHVAAQERHIDVLEMLIERGNFDVNQRDSEGATAMHCVFYEPDEHFSVDRNDHIEVVKFLMNSGAKVNCADKPDEWTALHYAACKGHSEVAAALIEFGKANVQAVSAYDRTPLHIAAEEGNIEVAKLLLENNANVNAEGMGKLTAFHLACMQGNFDMAMLLVNHGADVNLKNEEKSSALHMACRGENIELVRFLLEQKIDVNALDSSNRSSLCIAKDHGADEAALKI